MAVADYTSDENPLLLSVNNGNIITSIDNHSEVIIPDTEGNSISATVSTYSIDALNTTNVMNISDVYEVSEPGYAPAADVIIPTYHNLQLDLVESQEGNSWCAAYCCSSIIRYLTSYDDIQAVTIMRSYHPLLSDAALEDVSLEVSEEIRYANNFGLHPTLRYAIMNLNEVSIQIANGSPVQFDMLRTDNGVEYRHAIVCRGYDKRYTTFSEERGPCQRSTLFSSQLYGAYWVFSYVITLCRIGI